jgi:hypothetical protein
MMKKALLCILILGVCMITNSWADGYETELTAGNTSIQAGIHYKKELANGFWKAGAAGLYTDDDDTEYQWLELDFSVGSDTLKPGLTAEVGIKGIIGDAEENRFSGDVGALAFSGQVGYVFSPNNIPTPLEVFAGLTYAPEIMSFRDTEDFLAYYFGIGVRIVQNASIILKYSAYDVDMEAGPGEWDLDENAIRLGLVMRF